MSKLFLTVASRSFGGKVLNIRASHLGKIHNFVLIGRTFRQLLTDVGSWKAGELIQNVMSYLDADTREFFITGILPEEWQHVKDIESDG